MRSVTSLTSPLRALAAAGLAAALALGLASPASAEDPEPGSPEYAAADLRNIADAYGRIIGPGGQLQNPRYLPALIRESTLTTASQLLAQVARPHRLALTPAMLVPGWNVGNPLRAGWDGGRGRMQEVQFTNRFGALLQGTLYAPLEDATDPYTGEPVTAPYPGVVITPGSVGGSQGMYEWLAQDLAERGYLVLLYDVQGQGTSETLPHTSGDAFPFCNPFAPPEGDPELGTDQLTPCPGVPFQQLANFTTGTVDALDFFTSTPDAPYPNPGAAGDPVDTHNPLWELWDRTPIKRPAAPGRTTRLALVGHSMGASAVSQVQGYDDRVSAVVALDKLAGGEGDVPVDQGNVTPSVPALGLQAEYGFTVTPWQLSGGSSLLPEPTPDGPDPMRERDSGYDRWADSGQDAMLVVGRATTHLDYTDIPLVLPASRYGQSLSSVYTQMWLDRYLKGDRDDERLLAHEFDYLEPVGGGKWKPVTLERDPLLSTRYCSAYAVGRHQDGDVIDVGCEE